MLNIWGLQLRGTTQTLPSSIGVLWAYLSTHPDVYEHLHLTDIGTRYDHSVMELLDRVDRFGIPDVVLVSMYTWNRVRTNKLTKGIREKFPNVIIIVGGPDVPQRQDRFDKFVADNPQYDYLVWSEGEIPLEMILRKILAERGIMHSEYFTDCYNWVVDGVVVNHSTNRRQIQHQAVMEVPSPGTLGIYDRVVQENRDDRLISIIETNRGCPYSCTFCDWGLEEKLRKFSMKRIQDDIEWALQYAHEIVIADANFGILERDVEIIEYLIARKAMLSDTRLHSVIVAYAKNNKRRTMEIAKLADAAGLTSMGGSFSLQSLHPPTLEAIKRHNMSITTDFQWITDNFTKNNIPYYDEMILGLPLETLDSFVAGIDRLLTNNPFDVYVNRLELLENSPMNLKRDDEKYGLTWTVGPILRSPIPDETEQRTVIKSTSTMTAADIDQALWYHELMQILWLGKTVYFAGQYLNRQHAVPASAIIYGFMNWQREHNTEWWTGFTNAIKKAYAHPVYDVRIVSPDHPPRINALVNGWMFVHGDTTRRNAFYSDFAQFVKATFVDVDPAVIDDLLIFNQNVVVRGPLAYTHSFDTEYDWLTYFDTQELHHTDTTYAMGIDRLGSTNSFPGTVSRDLALYFMAGGHDYLFIKTNTFVYNLGHSANARGVQWFEQTNGQIRVAHHDDGILNVQTRLRAIEDIEQT